MGRGTTTVRNIRRNAGGLGTGGVSSFRLQTLNISPFRYEPLPNISSIYTRQNDRYTFHSRLGGGGGIGGALERINEALEPAPRPVPNDLGSAVGYEETRQRYIELMAVLSEVSLDSDALSRGMAVARINQLLEVNEDTLIRMMNDPARSSLQGIIVREDFYAAVLGGYRPSASSLDQADERRDAFYATNIPVPSPMLLDHAEIQQIFAGLACMDPRRADAASGG